MGLLVARYEAIGKDASVGVRALILAYGPTISNGQMLSKPPGLESITDSSAILNEVIEPGSFSCTTLCFILIRQCSVRRALIVILWPL